MARHPALTVCLGTLAALIFAVESGAGDASPRTVFPEPVAMEHQVSFWPRVYVEIGTDAGFVHDDPEISRVKP